MRCLATSRFASTPNILESHSNGVRDEDFPRLNSTDNLPQLQQLRFLIVLGGSFAKLGAAITMETDRL
ncbi:hypothetical protein [Nostoc sp. 106C]|uniref:hypothetical protein n=1 Tax=Nostoc sp. 106C TaxID=1932667 RepID=UPI000A3A9296|nr:hypothetical protein [Nostoc sp. 106C]OUL21588.1 hypothetical protein BV375_29025 [Nostoc sp. 106C]